MAMQLGGCARGANNVLRSTAKLHRHIYQPVRPAPCSCFSPPCAPTFSKQFFSVSACIQPINQHNHVTRPQQQRRHVQQQPRTMNPNPQKQRHLQDVYHSHRRIQKVLDRASGLLAGTDDGAHIHNDVAMSWAETCTHFSHNNSPFGVSMHERVFANNHVNLENVKAIGFDYDYTLVNYKTELQRLIYDMATDHLGRKLHYPTIVLERGRFNPNFAIRGLAVDMKHGLLIKLNYTLDVTPECVYRGHQPVSMEECRQIYGEDLHVSPEYREMFIKPLNDLFSLCEAQLLADVMQGLINNSISFDPESVAADVCHSISHTHSSGKMHHAVRVNPKKYIRPSAKVGAFLRGIKDTSDKKLFLASNSGFRFVDAGMKYIVGDEWRDLFDIVIVSADKPAWYTKKRPFREINPTSGRAMWNNKVDQLKPDAIYSGGSIAALQESTGWVGHDILYFGDSLFADLVEARRRYGFYTGAIIGELEKELEIVQGEEYGRLVFASTVLEELLRQLQELIYRTPFFHDGSKLPILKTEEDDKLVTRVEAELQSVKTEMRTMFNKRFGSCFRSVNNPTQFAFALYRYCDFYTSQISNCDNYPQFANRRLYPNMSRSLPHEPVFPRTLIASYLAHQVSSADDTQQPPHHLLREHTQKEEVFFVQQAKTGNHNNNAVHKHD
eukprot:m.145507 g.145507  ORF g.145507 m.145507 type:complete len:668 (-) comp30444_c0_seq2:724-2727(-)